MFSRGSHFCLGRQEENYSMPEGGILNALMVMIECSSFFLLRIDGKMRYKI